MRSIGFISWLVPTLLCLCLDAPLFGAEPPLDQVDKTLLLAVEEAITERRFDQALRLIKGQPDHPQLRFWQAQALAAVYGPQQAYDHLTLPQGAASFAMAESWLADWPSSEHGPLASFVGDLAQLLKRRDALIWWSLAIDAGGPRVDRDRLFLAIAEEAAQQQRWELVRTSSHTLWSRRAELAQRLRAGELLGLALLIQNPDQAFDHFITLLAQRGMAAEQRARIAVHMGQAWWRDKPALILRLSRASLAEEGLAAQRYQDLRLWRAMALAQLDPEAGHQALLALPDSQRAQPLLQNEIKRLEQFQDQGGGVSERRKRAEAALALGDILRAERILSSLYQEDGASLALWLQLPDRDLKGLMIYPSASSLEGGFRLAQLLASDGFRAEAWQLLHPLLDQSGPSQRVELDRISWGLSLASDQAPRRRKSLLAQARRYPLQHSAVGQAWAELAIAQQQTSHPDEVLETWWKAFHLTPEHSPWLAVSIEQILSLSLAGATPWRQAADVDLVAVQRVEHLAAVMDRVQLDDAHRLQWLLAQFLVQQRQLDGAIERLQRLQHSVSSERSARIAEVVGQLQHISQ